MTANLEDSNESDQHKLQYKLRSSHAVRIFKKSVIIIIIYVWYPQWLKIKCLVGQNVISEQDFFGKIPGYEFSNLEIWPKFRQSRQNAHKHIIMVK